jgi:hypothetical protein
VASGEAQEWGAAKWSVRAAVSGEEGQSGEASATALTVA